MGIDIGYRSRIANAGMKPMSGRQKETRDPAGRAKACWEGEYLDGGARDGRQVLWEKAREEMATTGKYLASQEEMVEARLPLGSRDLCSKLLIPLNKCRQDTFYLPWKCEDERHSYEKCEYDIFLQRMKKMQEIRLQGKATAQGIPATQ